MNLSYIKSNFWNNTTLLVILTSVVHKSMPLLFGLVVLWQYDKSTYESYVYMTVYSVMFTVLISAGVAPSLIRKISAGKVVSEVISSHFSIVLVLAILLVTFAGVYFFNNEYVARVDLLPMLGLGFFTVISSMAIPVLQARKNNSSILYSSLFFFFTLSFLHILSTLINNENPLYVYSLSYAAYATCLIVSLIRLGYLNENFILNLLSVNRLGKNVRDVSRGVSWIFASNVIWMISIFCYHSLVKGDSDISDTYIYFGFGYQVFSLLVFIPNSLSPLMISHFSLSKNSEAGYSLGTSYVYIFISTIFAVIFSIYLLYNQVLGFEYIVTTVFAGIFASGVAPLSQFLVAKEKANLILPSAIAFPIVLFGMYIFNENYYHMYFLVAYFSSYALVAILVKVVYDN